MGEIADGLINGDFDFYTGEYIGRGYGIPRTHNRSLPWEGASFNPVGGVIKFLLKKGIKRTEDIIDILQKYVEHRKWEFTQGNKFIRKVSIKIQEDWPAFASWAGNKIANDKKKTHD